MSKAPMYPDFATKLVRTSLLAARTILLLSLVSSISIDQYIVFNDLPLFFFVGSENEIHAAKDAIVRMVSNAGRSRRHD